MEDSIGFFDWHNRMPTQKVVEFASWLEIFTKKPVW